MKLSVTHDELPGLMRRLHAAGVAWALCELTGPGWIVSYNAFGLAVAPDVAAYRRVE